jgi:hypothetical protein
VSGNRELDDLLAQAQAQDELDDDVIELDLSETGEDRDFTPFRGKHLAEIIKADLVKAKSSGNPMLKCEATVIEGEHKGQHLWFNLMLKGNLWFTKLALKALGQPLDVDHPTVQRAKLIGVQFIAETKIVPAVNDRDGNEVYKAKTEVKGFTSVDDDTYAE